MKFILIPLIALGLVLSLVIGIEYNCNGGLYYGSPYIFMEKSQGSSLTYYYSVSGIIKNIFLWGLFLYIVNRTIEYCMSAIKYSILINTVYKFIVGIMIVITTLNIAWGIITLGHGFDKNRNYWYWDVDRETKERGETCKGKWISFR